MRKSLLSVLPLACVLACACGSTDLPSQGEGADPSAVGKVSSPIINGQLDTTHAAVVAIALQQGNNGGLCTGTIIKVDPASGIGWVLTAAHCTELPPAMVLQGNDFNAPDFQYAVVDYEADSRYQIGGKADQPYDVAVVRISGVDASTPTIGIASQSDGIGQGTTVTALGYGKTSGGNGGDPDGKRRKVTVQVQQTSSAQILYGMDPGGTCQGDSGGPDLVSAGGVEKVIGIHSYGDQGCQQESVSGRVSGNLAFINKQLSKPLPEQTCKSCQESAFSGNNKCAQLNKACLDDADCAALYKCLTSAGSNASAQKSCLGKYPDSVGKILATQECGCTGACAEVCATDANCKDAPKCGFGIEGSCGTCGEGACCQEMFDCTADGACYGCLQSGDKDAKCATNDARRALATCFSKSCSSECSGSGIDTNVPTNPDPGTGSTDGTDDTTDGDDDGDGASTTSTNGAQPGQTVTTTTSGCSLAAGGTGGSRSSAGVFALAVGLGVVASRRRGRRAH